MGISSSQLEAFSAVVRMGGFSAAARSLHITQSALSQRILNLESALGSTLLVRDPAGPRLTPAGEELLRYSQVKDAMEQEVLSRMRTDLRAMSGHIRIGGFSSVVRSVLMPAVRELIAKHSALTIELMSREIRDLPRMLTQGEVEMVVTTALPFRDDMESHLLGYEEYVLVQAKGWKSHEEVYLDHDTEDRTTIEFLKLNGRNPKSIRRHYVDEVYAILDGVKLRFGKAVLPRHLIQAEKDLIVSKGFRPLKVPVMLQYFRMPFYSNLHQQLLRSIISVGNQILNQSRP
jgi:DNA-binding transcriptional LysR family regulator